MKKTFLVLTSLLIGIALQAQKIKYEPTLEKAINAALQLHKPIAILITIQPPAAFANYMKGLADENVVDKFNSSFINFKTEKEIQPVPGKLSGIITSAGSRLLFF